MSALWPGAGTRRASGRTADGASRPGDSPRRPRRDGSARGPRPAGRLTGRPGNSRGRAGRRAPGIASARPTSGAGGAGSTRSGGAGAVRRRCRGPGRPRPGPARPRRGRRRPSRRSFSSAISRRATAAGSSPASIDAALEVERRPGSRPGGTRRGWPGGRRPARSARGSRRRRLGVGGVGEHGPAGHQPLAALGGPAEDLDGLGRPAGEHPAEDLGLEPPVVVPGQLGPERDLVADPPLHPLAAVDPHAEHGRLVDQPGLISFWGLSAEESRRPAPGPARSSGTHDGRAEAMLEGIGPGASLPSAVLGPVESWALRRLAASRASEHASSGGSSWADVRGPRECSLFGTFTRKGRPQTHKIVG